MKKCKQIKILRNFCKKSEIEFENSATATEVRLLQDKLEHENMKNGGYL